MKQIAWAMLATVLCAPCVWAAGYPLLNIGVDYFNQERFADAVGWLDKAIAAGDLTQDQLAVAHFDRGLALVQTGAPDKAVDDFSAALAIRPNDIQIAVSRAFSYVTIHQPEKALSDLNQLQSSRPDNQVLNFERGLVNWQAGHFEDANDAFTKAAKSGQPYPWLWLQLTNVKLGRPITVYSYDSSPIAGLHYRNQSRLGWPGPLLAFFEGEHDEAFVQDALKQDGVTEGMNCEANFYLSEWHILHGDRQGARPLMEKASIDCPKSFLEYRMAQFEMEKLP